MTGESKLEFWTNMGGGQYADPSLAANQAPQREADGWDGVSVVDTQCISVDPYVTLGMCAQNTRRVKLSTGVTNPLTRHPAVTAAAIATLQVASGGRAVLGIGRGDSALAFLGASPQPISRFERALEIIQTYLRGDEVALETAAEFLVGAEAGYAKLSIGEPPPASWLKWLPADHRKVPMDVSVTGAKAIGIAARVAERVSFALGAHPERIKWALQISRQAAEAAGRDPAAISHGAWLIVCPHEDIRVARKLAAASVSSMSRFLIINKKLAAPTSAAETATLERLASAYDMKNHTRTGAQTAVLDDGFIDSFGVVGSPERCIDRIREIVGLGITRLNVACASTANELGRESYRLIIEEVLPRLRA